MMIKKEEEVPTVAIDFKGVQKWDGIIVVVGDFSPNNSISEWELRSLIKLMY
jgi:hypothetical protein